MTPLSSNHHLLLWSDSLGARGSSLIIILSVIFGSDPSVSIGMEFLVVKSISAFNVIIGRPTLNALDAVVSTKHFQVQFPVGEKDWATRSQLGPVVSRQQRHIRSRLVQLK